eukprot:UN27702
MRLRAQQMEKNGQTQYCEYSYYNRRFYNQYCPYHDIETFLNYGTSLVNLLFILYKHKNCTFQLTDNDDNQTLFLCLAFLCNAELAYATLQRLKTVDFDDLNDAIHNIRRLETLQWRFDKLNEVQKQ